MKLLGSAEEVAIRLERSGGVRAEPTYIGRTSYKQVTLTNRSDIIAHFKWSAYATEEQEAAVKGGYARLE